MKLDAQKRANLLQIEGEELGTFVKKMEVMSGRRLMLRQEGSSQLNVV
jgi:hypothetical protein